MSRETTPGKSSRGQRSGKQRITINAMHSRSLKKKKKKNKNRKNNTTGEVYFRVEKEPENT